MTSSGDWLMQRGARTHACRAETHLGACAWTAASANKRRDESRRGTHECVRHACSVTLGWLTYASNSFHHASEIGLGRQMAPRKAECAGFLLFGQAHRTEDVAASIGL